MDLTHRFSVPAELDTAWAAFSRLDQIAPCFPGATVTVVNGRDYAGLVKIKFGPVPLVYNGSAHVKELNRSARRMVIEAVGEDRRGNGTATAQVTVTFVDRGDSTDVSVQTDLSITGRPAQFGGGVISDVSDRLLDLFVSCISARFRDGEFDGQRGADAEPTVELGGLPGAAEAAAAASYPRTASSASKPSGEETQPHLQMITTFVPIVLKRYWPVLVGVALGLGIVGRLLRRRR